MTRHREISMVLVLASLLASPAWAQSGRFSMIAVEEGALRLNSETGAISLCSRKDIGWTCEPLADQRLALQSEIERLMEENRALKKQIEDANARLAEKQEQPPAAKPPDAERDQGPLRVPTDEDIDNLMAFFDKMMRRFQDAIESIKPNPSRPL